MVQIWAEHLLPRLTDVALGTREIRRHHERAMVGLQGEVVEIGFGSGLNVPLYPSDVHTVHAVEPSMVGRQLSAGRVAASPASITFVGLDGQDLPLPNDSADMALSTFTLCTITDPVRAVREAHRVLRPGGQGEVPKIRGRRSRPMVCEHLLKQPAPGPGGLLFPGAGGEHKGAPRRSMTRTP